MVFSLRQHGICLLFSFLRWPAQKPKHLDDKVPLYQRL
jgi:hypothetical protein